MSGEPFLLLLLATETRKQKSPLTGVITLLVVQSTDESQRSSMTPLVVQSTDASAVLRANAPWTSSLAWRSSFPDPKRMVVNMASRFKLLISRASLTWVLMSRFGDSTVAGASVLCCCSLAPLPLLVLEL